MFSILNSRLLQRPFLLRLLQTTGLSLALMTAIAAGVHAQVQGSPGVNGADGVNPGDWGQPGGDGGAANASGSATGGNGGNGGDGVGSPDFYGGGGGNGGNGGAANASGSATGGNGGNGGNGGIGGPAVGFEGGYGGEGGDGGTATATAVGSATAIGGHGGNGGNAFGGAFPGVGGWGGAANATAATTVSSGSADASANAQGGDGGTPGTGNDGTGGSGGAATASATGTTERGNVTASASATGGNGGTSIDVGGAGGNASATSTAIAKGSGNALSSANATGGEGDLRYISGGLAAATAEASAAGGGKAIATAVATGTGQVNIAPFSATSNAETVNGAEAQALSTAEAMLVYPYDTYFSVSASSTAKTSFVGVTTTASAALMSGEGTLASTEAIAQGGSVQTSPNPSVDAAISIAVPDKAYATTLIGGASNVAEALLGPQDEIFGAAILAVPQEAEFEVIAPSSTFDFRFQGDLLLGVIADGGFDISINGAAIPFEDTGDNSIINLGSNFGPNIDLTISGEGVFVLGGAVPEPSTWAMMLLGFAGLGFVGYRQTRRPKPHAA